MARIFAIGIIGLTLAAALPAQGNPGTDLFVPAGEVLAVDHQVVALHATILGTLVQTGAGDLWVNASFLEVGPVGRILARDAPAQLGSLRQTSGNAGGDGASLHLNATRLVVDLGAIVTAGSGGAGAPALGGDAVGGAGGRGGSVWVDSQNASIIGLVAPGRGGDGGSAWGTGAGPQSATGGPGGASGQLLVQGVVEGVAAMAAPPSTLAFTPGSLCSDVSSVVGPSTAVAMVLPCGIPLSPYVLLPGVTGGLTGGTPGTPGLLQVPRCAVPMGRPGTPNLLGDGGSGGSACVDAEGSGGGAGDAGSSGFITCRDGGPGGPGGDAGGAGAQGGNGGEGTRNGGAGGFATAIANGGNGGAGGAGGNRTLGTSCAGGDGGAGGSAADATASGGNGGRGLCQGGAGGGATASANGGTGGAGGAGDPNGLDGAPGLGGTATPTPGSTGFGLGLHC
ncbi:MAG: hypothetical protein ACYDBQ_10905 [Thermoplasmatota archaeon]